MLLFTKHQMLTADIPNYDLFLTTMNIIDLIPSKHFGMVYEKTFSNALHGESTLLFGVKGSGLIYFLRKLYNDFQDERLKCDYIDANIYNSDIGNDLKEKAEKYCVNDRFIIILSNIQDLNNVDTLFDTFVKLREKYLDHIVIILGWNENFLTTSNKLLSPYSSMYNYVYAMPLFDLEGTKRNIKFNSEFYGYNISESASLLIHKLSGGNPNISKALCRIVKEESENILKDNERLCQNPMIYPKLDYYLSVIFKMNINQLKQLNLISKDGNLLSELLRYRIDNFSTEDFPEITVNMTKREKQIFSYLYINKDKLVTTEKIDFILNLIGDSYSLWASYKAINRLKKKIEKYFALRNIKGQGYILEEI